MTVKKLIGFVQPNFQQGPAELNVFFLPYSAGILLAYCFDDPIVRNQYELGSIIWRRDSVSAVAESLSKHDIVGFSTYVWNHRYNYHLAREIKKINPKVICVFGGPEIAINDKNLFSKEPFMDVVIKGEGEHIFKKLLITPREQWHTVPGLLINQGDQIPIDTGPGPRIENLDDLPSPYLNGMFDDIVANNPGINWSATIETNRGCPYACTFCDWGSLTYNKVKKFNLERVFAELDWIGKHCGHVTLTDANFGMFVERDNLILDKLIETKNKYNNLKNFTMSWAKNQKNEVVQMTKKLMQSSPGFGQGLTVSVQSMDDDVLDNIKRRNMELNKITEIFDICNKENIPVYTELILGLPGETPKSWKENFWKIFRAGNHHGVNIFQAQMLENAEMNLLQKRIYRIETSPVMDYISDSYEQKEIEESIELVVSTKDINRQTMLDLMTWNTFILAFHIGGISSFLARFVEKYLGVDYEIFYSKLEASIDDDSWLRRELLITREHFSGWINNGRANHKPIGGVKVPGWFLIYRILVSIHHQNKLDEIMCWLQQFMSQNFDLPDIMLKELIRFQRHCVTTHKDLKKYPVVQDYQFDFLGYVLEGRSLESPTRYEFFTIEDVGMSENRFLENFHFGRKRQFGKSIIRRVDNC